MPVKPKRTNRGGPRIAGPGKRMGAPPKMGSSPMIERNVRYPKSWIDAITQQYGNFGEGVRALLQETPFIQSIPPQEEE